MLPVLLLLALLSPRHSALRVGAFTLATGCLAAGFLTLNRIFWFAAATEIIVFSLLTMRNWKSRQRRAVMVGGVALVAGLALTQVLLASQSRIALSAPGTDLVEFLVDDPRGDLWRFALGQIAEHPWIGAGIGKWTMRGEFGTQFHDPLRMHAHNVFLNRALETGLAGPCHLPVASCIARVAFWRLAWSDDGRNAALGAAGLALVAGVIVKNLTDDFLVRQNALLFWSLAGAALGAAARTAFPAPASRDMIPLERVYPVGSHVDSVAWRVRFGWGPAAQAGARNPMKDVPLLVLTATIWTYWIGVGVMIVRVRRKMRHTAGPGAEQRFERFTSCGSSGCRWSPAWIGAALGDARALRKGSRVAGLRDERARLRRAALDRGDRRRRCLGATIKCWATHGQRLADGRRRRDEGSDLITDGLFARIRHPIYAFCILLMLCTVAIVPDAADARASRSVHIVLMNVKARNEERHLLGHPRRRLRALPARPRAASCRAARHRRRSARAGVRTRRRCAACGRSSRWRHRPALSALAFAAARDASRAAARAVDADAGDRAAELDPAIAARLLALDPENIGARDVAEVLAKVPAPRIILLQGSFAPRHDGAVRGVPDRDGLSGGAASANPRDGRRSTSSFTDSRQLAGTLAWYYETEGMRPMLIGHSQGGMLAIRMLHELAGAFGDAIPVWNPLTDEALPRTTIVDPRERRARPVVGLRVPYAAAIATGKLPRLLLGQWSMLAEAAQDSRHASTNSPGSRSNGTSSPATFGGAEPYVATGTAAVRNVTLPADVQAHRPAAGRASRRRSR